jgi:hypothetical protein
MLLCGLFALHVCAADRGCQVSTRPSLRPLFPEGVKMRAKLGRNTPREAKVCLQAEMPAGRARLSPHTSSLRAQRSNPESLRGGSLDCFAALAMTRRKDLCATLRSRAPDAVQRPFGGALLSRGPSLHMPCRSGSRLCAAALHAAARPGHGPATRSAPLTIFWRCSCCHFSSRNGRTEPPGNHPSTVLTEDLGLKRVWQC